MRALLGGVSRLVFGALVAVVSLQSLPVHAHGERAQEPYLRTRTAHWYDVKWSTDKLSTNQDITVTARFRLFSGWPDAVQMPDTVFVSNATPGPVFARIDSYLNGVPARQSFRNLEIGRDYEYKMVLRARIPGRYHVHPMIAIKGSGPLVGPGRWIEVGGTAADFKYSLTAISGEKIEDLETWGVQAALGWHSIWLVIAAAWVIWWVRRPILIPRYIALKKEREDLLTTDTDLKVGIALLVVAFGLAFYGYSWAQSKYPRTVPLQAGTMYTPPLPAQAEMVKVEFQEAKYDVPGRSMRMVVKFTNISDKPLLLGEFSTASIRFVNHAVPAAMARVDDGYPKELVARAGLVLDDNAALKPGESRTVRLDATDATWEIERLTSFITDVDSKVGGLLFFFDAEGNRYLTEVGGPILPVFKS